MALAGLRAHEESSTTTDPLPSRPACPPQAGREQACGALRGRSARARHLPPRRPDGVEMTQDLAVGAEDAALVVGQAVAPAVGTDERLGPAEAGPGFVGVVLVFDLVVQPAKGEVGEQAAVVVA